MIVVYIYFILMALALVASIVGVLGSVFAKAKVGYFPEAVNVWDKLYRFGIGSVFALSAIGAIGTIVVLSVALR